MSLDGETEGAYGVKESNINVDRVCVLRRKHPIAEGQEEEAGKQTAAVRN